MAAALLAGCAAVAPPTGGPKDTTPPRFIGSSPDSAARNVRQKFVRLTFSEFVQLKDISKNLLITPNLAADNNYKVREDRTSVTLTFDKPLDDSTTYSFDFRDAVVDITESLPAKNVRLSFSTGPVLDSGQVRGTVTDVLTAKPVAEASVSLYRAADTVTVRNGRPYYTTRTDAQGKYSIGFLRPGRYRLYAVVDKNQNSRYDEGEKIAYLPAPVAIGLGDILKDTDLVLTQPDRRPPLVSGQQPGPAQLRLSFSEGVRTAVLTALPPATATASEVAAATQIIDRGRAAVLFKTPAIAEGRYLLVATDSTGNAGRDTLNVRFPAPPTTPTAAARKAAAAPLYAVEGSPAKVFRQGQVVFVFQVPVVLAPKQPIGTLAEDSVKRRPLRVPADATLSSDGTRLTVQLDTRAKKRLDIELDSTTILAITGQRLGLKPLRLALTEEASTGTVAGPIITTEKNFDLQLLDDKGVVVNSLRSPKGRYKFDNLAPGTYRLRVLIDRDGDGRWRGGDPDLRLLPEPVYLLPKPLQARANWEVEEKLSF